MLGILFLVAAICLIVLNPFAGAATIGTIALIVAAVVTVIQLVVFAGFARTVKRGHDSFFERHRL